MTSSYGYQRPLSNEEQLYLQNQALQAELQRREQEKPSDFIDTLGKTALAAGAVAGAVLGGRRLMGGKNTSATFDLSKLGEKATELSRAAAARVAPQEVVPASRPAPATTAERLQQGEEVVRVARAERPQGTQVLDLDFIRGEAQAIADLKRDFEAAARTEVADQFLARGGEPRAVTGGLAKTAVQPQDFLNEAVEEVAVKVLDQPGKTFGGAAAPAGLLEPIARSRKEAVYSAVAAKPESELPRVYKPSGGTEVELITDPNTGEIFRRGKSPESFNELYLQRQGYVDTDTLVDQYQTKVLGRIDQFANAANPAEDQATGRMKMALQRNEDNNLAAIEMAEDAVDAQIAKAAQGDPTVASVTELDSAINQVASTLPDGLPVDQVERLPKDPWTGSATVPTPQRSTAPSVETKLLPSAAVSPRKKSQQFLQQRFEELGTTIASPTRRERILSADPALAEAYELYASTGDPSVLSRLSETPSSPVNVTLREQSEFVSPEVATKNLYKPGVYPEYIGDLIEKDIELTNQISSLSQEKLNIAARQKELGEQELMLKYAMAQEPTERDSYSRMLGKVKYEQQNLPAPESLNVDIGDAMAERDFTRVQLKSAESLGPRYKLTPRQEGTRAFYEQTPEGQIIPETLEVRGGRPSVELEPKTGGGRRGAEYDPSSQTGSRKGTYGLESTRYPQATSAQRPTQYTADELVQEALEQATASLEGDVPIPPPEQQVSRQFGPRASKQSLVASEIARRAMIEGRDIKEALRKGGFGI